MRQREFRRSDDMPAVLEKPKVKIEDVQRLVLSGISWRTYDLLLHEFEGRHLRITYDRGTLEIMTVSYEHEFSGRLLGFFIVLMAVELQIALHSGGSTILRKMLVERGL